MAIGLSDGFAVDLERRKSLKVQTSGRTELIRGGLELAEERPVAGYGSGSFEREFGRRFGSGSEAAAVASHTEPVTVAAEQGVIGLAAYVAVLSIALGALCAGIRRSAPGLRGGGRGLATGEALVVATARAALLAAVVAMVLHSLSYAAFFTDPITWALLATGLALARAE
jgi:O-antigen ligase